ncbi:MAG: cysteine peptidase family C39 domain-containing protein [bacterium]|nr:cysteine peptidase family C39 domain-containing protein [bacterium]
MLPIRPIKQKAGYTCGPTCIAMLARYYDIPLSWAAIMRACKIDRNGMSNEDLVRALRRLHFSVRARKRWSWNELKGFYRERIPVVIAWMLQGHEGHFSIVAEVGKNHVVLADPDGGKHRRMPKDVFMRLWFDYDDVFFPKRAKDLHLRWGAVVKLNGYYKR